MSRSTLSVAQMREAAWSSGVYTSSADFIEAMLRWYPRGADGVAPAWAAHVVRRMAAMFFEDHSWMSLRSVTSALIATEEKARATQSVLLAFFPERSVTGADDHNLGYTEAKRVMDALEKVAWA